MPFQQNIIDKGISWAIVVDSYQLYVTANFLMNVSTCFYWNQMTVQVTSVVCPPVLEDLMQQAAELIKFSKFSEHNCAL